MEKQRNFGLDIIRVMALLMVVMYHYEIEVNINDMKIFTHFLSSVRHINFGGIGVFLFFMLSGSVHAMKYDGKFALKTYYKKRFLSIFPLFYITWIIGAGVDYLIYDERVIVNYADSWRVIFTVLGCDGYFPQLETFYIVGEWFTTVIVFIYLIYPILQWLLQKHLVCYLSCLLAINLFFIADKWNPLSIVLDGNCFFAITAFSIGFIFQKYRIQVQFRESIVSFFIMSFFLILSSKYFEHAILNISVAIMIYLLVGYGPIKGYQFKNKYLIKVIGWLAKNSYVFYLTHHFVLKRTIEFFKHANIPLAKIWCLIVTVLFICIFSILVNRIHDCCAKIRKLKM